MRIEKNRYLQELMALLESEGPLTSSQLAERARASVRSVKGDMVRLSAELEKEGSARIVSRKAAGYVMEPLDMKKYQELQRQVRMNNALFSTRPASIVSINRILYIIQKLLAYGSVKKSTLCEELYVSESTLAPDLARAEEYFVSYGLKVVSVPGQGLQVRGPEQNLRASMVEMACSAYHDIELLYPVEAFDQLFYDSYDEYQRVRHALLKRLRESRISVLDINSKKLAVHLCLMRSRLKEGHLARLKSETCREIKAAEEYRLAQTIFADADIRAWVPEVPEIEVVNFARLILINRDMFLSSQEDLDTVPPEYLETARSLFAEMKKDLRQTPYRQLVEMDLFRTYENDYVSLVLQLYLRHHFASTSRHLLVTYIEGVENFVSPLAGDLASRMVTWLEKAFGESITGVEVQIFGILTDFLLKQVHYPYAKRRLAVTSMMGRSTGSRLARCLLERFGPFIASVNVLNLYEMRRLNFADYDAVIANYTYNLYYRYPIPYVSYNAGGGDEEKERMFAQLFRAGYEDKLLLEELAPLRIFNDTETENYEEFVRALIFKYGKDEESLKKLTSAFAARGRTVPTVKPQSEAAILPMEERLVSGRFFDIYRLKTPLSIGFAQEVRAIVAISLPMDSRPASLRMITDFLNLLSTDARALDTLLEDPERAMPQLRDRILKEEFDSRI
jgi:hypothetical protein